MRKLIFLSCLAVSACASADDSSVRAMLQAKYDAVNAAMAAGDMRAIGTVCNQERFIATDVQKRHQSFAQFLKALGQKAPQKFEIKTLVESADTLNGMAKAALRITSIQVVLE